MRGRLLQTLERHRVWFGTLARDLSEKDAQMRNFESSHARMGLTTRLGYRVLSEYNPSEQAPSSVEDDFRLALIVDRDATDRKGVFSFAPSNPRKAWMAPLEGEACASNHLQCEIANSLPVD